MKSLRVMFIMVVLFFCAGYLHAQADKVKANDKMPYMAIYSSDFKMGNTALSKKVLDIWKAWDDNELERHDYMADTLVMMLPDGTVLKGKAEVLESSKKYRNSLSAVKSQMHAWVPLYSNDRKEDAVLVWGMEENTKADGTKENTDLHEVWWFNKDGKVVMMRQWSAHFGAQ